jgi:hypothetical protein
MWQRQRLAVVLAALAGVGFAACGGSSTKAPGSFATTAAGATSTGGETSAGGAMSPGGARSTGDTTSTSDTTSAGGVPSVGGVTIAGGMMSMGGTPSAGGATTVDGGPGVGGTTNVVDAPGAGGAAEVGGATSVGGAIIMGGATGGSPTAGGSLGTGGAIATGGTTSSTSGPTGGGYFVSGDWHGYAWTSASLGSTIAPSDFSADTTGFPFCAKGTVVPSGSTDDAEIGFNINQAQGQNTPVGTWQPTTVGVGGVVVNVSNPGGSTLLVELTVPGTTNYWATIGAFDQDFLILWTTFNTLLDQSGSTYAGQPIQDIDVRVPGKTVTTTYSFCVNSITIDTSTITPQVTCATPSRGYLREGCTSGLYCGDTNGIICCKSSYPYYCSQTNWCFATQNAAAAACGSACAACYVTTCRCGCSCGDGITSSYATTQCQARVGDCGSCCMEACIPTTYAGMGQDTCTSQP